MGRGGQLLRFRRQGETSELRGANSAPANGVRAGSTRRRYGVV